MIKLISKILGYLFICVFQLNRRIEALEASLHASESALLRRDDETKRGAREARIQAERDREALEGRS